MPVQPRLALLLSAQRPALPPPAECAEKMVIREDDNAEVVRARLATYEAEIEPILSHYRSTGDLVHFGVKRGLDDVPRLLKMIEVE